MKRFIRSTGALRSRLVLAVVLVGMGLLLAQCSEETAAPVLPGSIKIVSGNNQFWLRGEQLPDPFVVFVTDETGTVAQGANVVFAPVLGGGTVSPSVVATNVNGRAFANLTLGPMAGQNRVRAYLQDDDTKSVIFDATAGITYCPEAEDMLSVSYGLGTDQDLFLVTGKSDLYPVDPGIVRVDPFSTAMPDIVAFTELTRDGIFVPVIWDAAFSPRGDFYVSRRIVFNEIMKVATDGAVTHFASIDDISEITLNPFGLLVGCDSRGPFVVGCRDTIMRYTAATFMSGDVNDDAVAVDPRRQIDDPLGEDVYFIRLTDNTLQRLALDSLDVGPDSLTTVPVNPPLTSGEAAGARGMVCDRDGVVYILVDNDSTAADTTKAILQIATDGTKTVLFDFYSRGGGSAAEAGTQRDLAIDQGTRFLFTLDTLNDHIIRFLIPTMEFSLAFDDSMALQEHLSRASAVGERVGLDVINEP